MTIPVVLGACGGEGTWVLETWGEELAEEGIGADAFADGCEASFERFLVVIRDRALLDDAGEPVVEVPGAQVYDLVPPGPHEAGRVSAPTGTWRTVRATIAPDAAATAGNATEADVALMGDRGASVVAQGALTCGGNTVTFDWSFDTRTTYDCDPENLVVRAGAEARTELTIHVDHLFYDSLVDPEAELRGVVLVAADADGDGVLTEAELAATPLAPTGYTVGAHDISELWSYLAAQSRSLGHVDGEGHCAVR